jgi:beta-ureidopropionase / N-carbamoyl-L-amino-acid hydrolase
MDRRDFARRLAALGAGFAAVVPGFLPPGLLVSSRGREDRRAGHRRRRAGERHRRAGDPHPGRDGSLSTSPLRVDGDRLLRSFEGLQEFGGTPDGGAHRPAYSDADREARGYVLELMRAAALEPRIDTAGNLLGRREGSEPGLPPILFGSHIDSVPRGGRYDGVVGSIGAVEVAHALADHGITTRHPIEVVVFQNEEGGLYGSRMMNGEFQPDELEVTAASGHTIREGTRLIGGDPDRLDEAVRGRGELAAFLELHIEQGSVLHGEGIDIGVVEGIVGIRWWEVEVTGFANHAGTTPMDRRQDALLAAARYVDAVNRIVRGHPGTQVGTVGRIAAEPGVPNVIPGRVTTSLELRDLEMQTINRLHREIVAAAEEIAQNTGTGFTFDLTVDLDPAPVDGWVQDEVDATAGTLDLSTLRMPSGAGHDAQSMARIAPIGMIFVPSVDGVSHSPEEFTSPEDMVNGANVLLNSVLALDDRLG